MPPPVARALTYVDTSVWCAYSFNEPESPAAVRWVVEAELDRTATALWTWTEFASAASIKMRLKGQTPRMAARASQAFEAAVAMARRLEAVADDFLHAAKLCRTPTLKLRAGDALHLAIALRHNCQALASLDHDMSAAARKLGMDTIAF